MRLFLSLVVLLCAGMLSLAQDKPVPPLFDFAKARTALWDNLADKHVGLGDDYKKAQVFTEARKQYNRALELNPEMPRAMRGLGFDKRKGEWVADKPLPEKDALSAADLLKARKDPDDNRTKEYVRCAESCRKLVEKAAKAGDERGRRIAATDVLYYAPADEAALKLRGQVKDGESYVPEFAKAWRDAGRKIREAASEGAVLGGEDEQAKAIGAKFFRRQSEYMIVRTSVDDERAKVMHKAAEANMKRAMELLGVKENPFGPGRKYNLLQVTREEFDAILTKVLKLEGDMLEFVRKLQGTNLGQPSEFMTRGVRNGADDMVGNTLASRIALVARGKGPDRPPWVTTGFSYLVTSQVLGSVSTVRYTLVAQGRTSSSHEAIPDFSKKSGSPDLLREIALYDITFKREMPVEKLMNLKVNDVDQSAAAKSFALMEFFFAKYPEQARKWLNSPAAREEEHAKELETAFGKPLAELEGEWREWVLAGY